MQVGALLLPIRISQRGKAMDQVKRVLYVHDRSIESDAANSIQVLKMCQAIAGNGYDLTLAVPESKSQGEQALKDTINNTMGFYPEFSIITYKKFTVFNKFKMLSGYFPVRRILREFKPDIVFLRNVVLTRAAMKTGTPFIYESHNSLMHNTSSFLNDYWSNHILRCAKSPLMRKFVVISEALGQFWIVKGMPEELVLAVHDGFDTKSFESPLAKEDARAKLELPLNKRIVLYIGSLYKDREIDKIIELAGKFDQTRFIIVGGNPGEVELYANLARKTGVENIEFKGRVNHIETPDYMYAADILLMTWSKQVKTINYCSPLKMFEYMAAGRVIVGHGFDTIREVLTDGVDAYLSNPDIEEELAEKLRIAIDSDSSEIGERARQKAFSQYSWQNRATLIFDSLPSQST